MSAPGVSEWFVQFEEPSPASRRVFIFPHAGSSVAPFRKWYDLIDRDIDLRVVQIPGSGGRVKEPGFTRMPELVDAITAQMRSLVDLPYVFFGHSLGALIAFETCLALSRHGEPSCDHLIVTGYRAPQMPLRTPLTYTLPDDLFLEKMKTSRMTPAAVFAREGLVNLFLPPMKRNCELGETYRYEGGPALSVPVTALSGVDDDTVTRDELEAWREITSGPATCREFSGDHFFIHDHVDEMTALLTGRFA